MTVSLEQIKRLAEMINQSQLLTFYGGAGTSTESGIPDYRSRHGVWTTMRNQGFDPVDISNPKFIRAHPEKYFAKRARNQNENIQPNATHKVLAQLELGGKDVRVITQNVDGLHQKAGHRYVLELHGDNRTWHCMECGREYKPSELKRDADNVPRCYVDQGVVRPNVVYFGENANPIVVRKARHTLSLSDLLIIAGTSLTTPLAKRLIQDFQGNQIVVINKEPLVIDPLEADLFIEDAVGAVFSQLEPYLDFGS